MLIIPPQVVRLAEMQKIGILLVGHGTRNPAGQAEFRQLFAQFLQFLEPIASELAFLELSEPSIEDAIASMASKQIRRVLTVPAILFTAGHAESDIPGAVNKALSQHGMQSIGQTAALECSQEVLELSAARFREAACDERCSNGCSNHFCSQASWVMVGRGSSSPTATDKTREFGRLRWRLTPTLTQQVAFIHGQQPTVKEALDQLAASQSPIAVVQPHLLFSGLLMNQLSEQVVERQKQNPNQRWVLAPTLGADRKLAELLANRAIHALETLSTNPNSR
ncbi:MAG: sirohydrochlorin chelatase [Pirellulales bacterium]